MYHYGSGKEELLAELLESTVTPSLAYARELLARDGVRAEDRLRELCRADVTLLCGGTHDLGGLYLLPEVRAERFAGFHAVRAELKDAYRQLIAATAAGGALAKGELELRKAPRAACSPAPVHPVKRPGSYARSSSHAVCERCPSV